VHKIKSAAISAAFIIFAKMGTQVGVLFETSYLSRLLHIFRDEARHGKAFEGLLKRYFG
jgi:hypothetical protein